MGVKFLNFCDKTKKLWSKFLKFDICFLLRKILESIYWNKIKHSKFRHCFLNCQNGFCGIFEGKCDFSYKFLTKMIRKFMKKPRKIQSKNGFLLDQVRKFKCLDSNFFLDFSPSWIVFEFRLLILSNFVRIFFLFFAFRLFCL